MNSGVTRYSLIIAVLTLFLLGGCATTKLVQSWSDPNYKGEPLQSFMVVGVMKDDVQRRVYEDQFVNRINSDDITAIPAYSLIDTNDDQYTKDELENAVRGAGVDGAIIARLVDIKEKQRYVQPTYEYEPMYGYGRGFYPYYGMSRRYVATPGYYTTDTIVELETVVFATSTGKMVWAGSTESTNPSSAESVIKKNADIIVKEMEKAGLLGMSK